MHGGALGSGGPKGQRNGNYKHGWYTARRAVAQRTEGCRMVSHQLRHACALSNKVLRWYTDCCRTPIANTKAMREALND
jgi:hypothetical protein